LIRTSLVYAEDTDSTAKHEIARNLVADLWERRDGVVSVQVLQEFFITVTKKLKKPLAGSKARTLVEEYLTWKVIDNSGQLLVAAIKLQQKAQLAFWDALIVQAAIDAGCDRLYSEDMNPGLRIESVVVINPFQSV